MYNVDKYTDSELYDILDLNHPSDRELEAKLLFMIHRYTNMQTASGQQLATFFEKIYSRFFEIEPDNEQEEDEENHDHAPILEGMVGQDVSNNLLPGKGEIKAPTISQVGNPTPPETALVGYTKTLDYTKDQLNPLLQQTIKRVISIDSQYRDDKTTLSTDFTFNLSDPLKDVVSLKLYSIQIPYTWYTISTSYGSNFFYLKGNSPGIDTGKYDYKIDISAGNYSPAELVNALNVSITKIKSQALDISFGKTGLTYNSNTSLITLSVDITKQYNETSYFFNFPDLSFANYLGFSNTTYRPYIINSYPFSSDYNPSALFSLDLSNNYFTVYKYIGPSNFDIHNSTIDLSFQLQLSLSLNAVHTRDDILKDISNQIQNCIYLDKTNSYIEWITGYSFQMALKPNRYTTNNIPYSKFAVKFPTETGNKKIWTGINSCFQFQNEITEMNTIVSETSPTVVATGQNNFIITNNPYIRIHCIKTGFDSPVNDFTINISNSGVTGYTLSQYVTAINNGISIANNSYFNNGIYEIDSARTQAFLDNNNIFNISVALHKFIHQTDFNADFTKSMFLSFPGESSLQPSFDLSTTTSIAWTFLFNPSITISNANANIVTLNYKNIGSNTLSYAVNLSNTANQNYTLENFLAAVNNAFTNFLDTDGVAVLLGSNLTFDFSTNASGINIILATLTLEVNKTLTQNDYSISFLDTQTTGPGTTWSNNLFLQNQVYNLSTPTNLVTLSTQPSFTTIHGTKALSVIIPKTLTVDQTNNTFQVLPWEDGVVGSKTFQYQLPLGTYTPATLKTVINNLFIGTDLSGSTLDISQNSLGQQYTSIRFSINKVYSASDYRVAFYDPISFVKCYVGVTSVRNTTWDTTVGWILGFRNSTIYDLSTYPSGSVVELIGDTGVSTNLFNYFLLCLDDYNQNHLNDGLVTITSTDTNISLPSYAKKSNFICDPYGKLTYNTDEMVENNKLTQAQIYSITQIANGQNSTVSNLTKSVSTKSYGSGPFVKDVFGIIPMKVAGLANGSSYVEFGGTLQNQERSYFGPVNIHRMSVKLVSDRGDIVDLNGANWSFSLICEQLYKQKPSATKESK
jgi:hypothetical protein